MTGYRLDAQGPSFQYYVPGRLCIKGCGEIATRPVRTKPNWSSCYCARCWQALPCNQRAQARNANPRRYAAQQAKDRRRISIGGIVRGYARTEAEARAIGALTRRSYLVFKQRQQARAKTESRVDGAATTQAATRDDRLARGRLPAHDRSVQKRAGRVGITRRHGL